MKKILWLIAALAISSISAGIASASTPSGFASATIVVSAQVIASCQEDQQVSFPNPLTIDTQSSVDQTVSPSADELVKCTNGTVFTIKVSSGNGTAVNQTCTSTGVSTMALKSASVPEHVIPYTILCYGDTDGSGHFIGAGFNTARALGMSLKIQASNAQTAVAHADYTDSVTLTISY